MDNKDLAGIIKTTGQLLELHGENKFKVKSYANAAFQIGRLSDSILQMEEEKISVLPGIGKGMLPKIIEIRDSGTLELLESLKSKTPSGVLDIMAIKGIGPSKVKALWQDLSIESMGELMYACKENRLVDLKGFGEKTQEAILKQIAFLLSHSGKMLYAQIHPLAERMLLDLHSKYPKDNISFTGSYRRKNQILEALELLSTCELNSPTLQKDYEFPSEFNIEITVCLPEDFTQKLFSTTAVVEHSAGIEISGRETSEEEIYKNNGLPFIIPELREEVFSLEQLKNIHHQTIIQDTDLKGILHNHSTYSDGRNTLKEMADACKELGYAYLGMADHSKSAFYAGGLKEPEIEKQWQEIDLLNRSMAPFKILKGIESDILYDGTLDYSADVLKGFDFVVASVHSQLKMDENKANQRLIKAIENPYTKILGHPTGRLLLSREGYPINHKKIIDACAANGVCIELNANPMRLDIDWRWLPYAQEKGVWISINPDAHRVDGYQHMHYGVCVARKGALLKENCLNALSLEEIEKWLLKH